MDAVRVPCRNWMNGNVSMICLQLVSEYVAVVHRCLATFCVLLFLFVLLNTLQ